VKACKGSWTEFLGRVKVLTLEIGGKYVNGDMGILDYLELLVISVLGPLFLLASHAIFLKDWRKPIEKLLTEKLWLLLLFMGLTFLTLVILSHFKGPITDVLYTP